MSQSFLLLIACFSFFSPILFAQYKEGYKSQEVHQTQEVRQTQHHVVVSAEGGQGRRGVAAGGSGRRRARSAVASRGKGAARAFRPEDARSGPTLLALEGRQAVREPQTPRQGSGVHGSVLRAQARPLEEVLLGGYGDPAGHAGRGLWGVLVPGGQACDRLDRGLVGVYPGAMPSSRISAEQLGQEKRVLPAGTDRGLPQPVHLSSGRDTSLV